MPSMLSGWQRLRWGSQLTTGTWNSQLRVRDGHLIHRRGGVLDDFRRSNSGTGANQATWTFDSLDDGTYQVSVHWTAAANRATNVAYTLSDNGRDFDPYYIDQTISPNSDVTVLGSDYQHLGGPVVVTGGQLSVAVSDNADGVVVRRRNPHSTDW